MLLDNIDYELVFQKTIKFALSYSSEICIDTSHKETVFKDGKCYAYRI